MNWADQFIEAVGNLFLFVSSRIVPSKKLFSERAEKNDAPVHEVFRYYRMHSELRAFHKELCDKCRIDKLKKMLNRGGLDVNFPLCEQNDALMWQKPFFRSCLSLPLSVAVSRNRKDVVDLLLQHGADINSAGLDLLRIAADKNNIDMAKHLFRKGVKIRYESFVGCAAMYAAVQKESAEMAALLLKHGYDKKKDEEFPLSTAAYFGSIKMTLFFLKKASKSEMNEALVNAAGSNSLNVVKLLLSHGADVHYKSAMWGKQDSLEAALNYKFDEKERKCSFAMFTQNKIKVIEALLKAGADLKQNNTVLHTFLTKPDTGLFQLGKSLIDNGAVLDFSQTEQKVNDEVGEQLLKLREQDSLFSQTTREEKREQAEKTLKETQKRNHRTYAYYIYHLLSTGSHEDFVFHATDKNFLQTLNNFKMLPFFYRKINYDKALESYPVLVNSIHSLSDSTKMKIREIIRQKRHENIRS